MVGCQAAKATRTPKALVCIELLYSGMEGEKPDVLLAQWAPEKNGVSREIKRRTLRDLEAAGLITVERRRARLRS